MKWVKQPDGKWKSYSKNVKDYNYYATYSYRDKIKKRLAVVWVDCDKIECKQCGGRYNLANPCIWHLSDSYEDRKKFIEFLRKERAVIVKSKSVNDKKEYKGLYE